VAVAELDPAATIACIGDHGEAAAHVDDEHGGGRTRTPRPLTQPPHTGTVPLIRTFVTYGGAPPTVRRLLG
jgi:hypothetical protein